MNVPFLSLSPDKIQNLLFWLRVPLPGCVKSCKLNDLCALTLQHNVILSTNSMSCQSETMSPVNYSCMPQKLHCQVKTTRGQWMVERHQIPCQDYAILFLIYHWDVQRRDVHVEGVNTWSLCNESAVQRMKITAQRIYRVEMLERAN